MSRPLPEVRESLRLGTPSRYLDQVSLAERLDKRRKQRLDS